MPSVIPYPNTSHPIPHFLHILTHTHPLFSLQCKHLHSHSHAINHTLSHSHTHTHTLSITHSHIHTLTHSHIHTLTHSHIHTLSHTITLTHSHILTRNRPSPRRLEEQRAQRAAYDAVLAAIRTCIGDPPCPIPLYIPSHVYPLLSSLAYTPLHIYSLNFPLIVPPLIYPLYLTLMVAMWTGLSCAAGKLWHFSRVEVFGSYAMGLLDPSSDLDLVVCFR